MRKIRIIEDKCTGCGLCIPVCSWNAVYLEGGTAKLNDYCNDCDKCVEVCPQKAIEVIGSEGETKEKKERVVKEVSPIALLRKERAQAKLNQKER